MFLVTISVVIAVKYYIAVLNIKLFHFLPIIPVGFGLSLHFLVIYHHQRGRLCFLVCLFVMMDFDEIFGRVGGGPWI